MMRARPQRLNSTLSPELQRAAYGRLGAVALTLGGVTATLRTVDIIGGPPTALATPIRWTLAAVAVAICLSVFIAIKRRYLTDRQALACGAAFQIVQGLLAAIGFHATGLADGIEIRGWTPIAVWMMLYPLIIPAPPRRVLIATLLTAATDPIGLWINVLAGASLPEATVLSHLFLPTLLACIVAPVTARIVYSLTVEVKRARELGSYRLVRRLGQGGMGEVWRAEHCMLARPAALKLIRPQLLGADERSRKAAVARFDQEARATAALRSTAHRQRLRLRRDGRGRVLLRDGAARRHEPRDAGSAIRPADAGAGGLSASPGLPFARRSARRGLIHRDIKPANIFTCRLGPDVDFVKVLDFGLVKQMATSDAQAVTVQAMSRWGRRPVSRRKSR